MNNQANCLQESNSQQRAVSDAQLSLTLANARYTGGLDTYLDVITAQEQVFSNERLATQIQGQQLVLQSCRSKRSGWRLGQFEYRCRKCETEV